MDHFSLAKSSNLQILLFSLIFFSQVIHLTLSYVDEYHPHFAPIHPDDKKVLVRIQKEMGNNTQPWISMTQCCYFFCYSEPMECSGSEGRIYMLTLTFKSPASCGTLAAIPPAIDDLISLTHLVLSGPYFTGPIPRDIPKLYNLFTLHVDNTSITGPILDTLLEMDNLGSFKLTNNKFITGPIPKALAKLTRLYELDLSSNQLCGPIPCFLGQMSNLTTVSLKSNKFSGPIPASLGRLFDLTILDLSHNQLTGSIPKSFASFNNSITLLLNNNRLTGSVPRAMARASMSTIDVSNNKLIDASTLFLFQNSNYFGLFTINLSNNRLKFNFSNAHFPDYLYDLNVSHNMIYGSLPKALGQLSFLNSIDVSYNQLCGPIPAFSASEQFSSTNFARNKCLCGAPLAPCNT